MKIHLFQNIIPIHISNQPTTESGLGATEQPAKIYWYWNVTTFLLSVYLVYNYIKHAMFQKLLKFSSKQVIPLPDRSFLFMPIHMDLFPNEFNISIFIVANVFNGGKN